MSPIDLLPQKWIYFFSSAFTLLHILLLDVSIKLRAHWALKKEQWKLATVHCHSSWRTYSSTPRAGDQAAITKSHMQCYSNTSQTYLEFLELFSPPLRTIVAFPLPHTEYVEVLSALNLSALTLPVSQRCCHKRCCTAHGGWHTASTVTARENKG